MFYKLYNISVSVQKLKMVHIVLTSILFIYETYFKINKFYVRLIIRFIKLIISSIF